MGPIEIGLLLIGLLIGPFINFAIYSFAYFPHRSVPGRRVHPKFSIENGSVACQSSDGCFASGSVFILGKSFG